MTALVAFLIGGLGTYVMRASFMTIGSGFELPAAFKRSLQFVAPAVFAAIILPLVLGDRGLSRFVAPDARLIAGIIASVVAFRTRNIPLVFAVGMVSLWLLRWAGFS